MLRLPNAALRYRLTTRCVHNTMRILNAQAFAMPAMSPTMEKGGIVEWKYKVGDIFSAGDVLLEVETDKAQIDVEALDDGKIAKIIVENGAKDIPVGVTIAYLADVNDDLSSLKFPKDSSSIAEKKATPKQSTPNKGTTSRKETSRVSSTDSEKSTGIGSTELLQKANTKQTLLPSVAQLLASRGITKDEALEKIKSSGKNGRLLKGDVLAYFGLIPKESVVNIAKYIKSGEQLDLSNIEFKKESDKLVEQQKPKENAKEQTVRSEPIIITEQIGLKVPSNVTYEQLSSSLDSFLDEAYHFTHEQPLTNIRSDFYDPIFEHLVTPSPTEARFDVTYQLTPVDTELNDCAQNDIFDLLSASNKSIPTQRGNESDTETSHNEYILTVNVQVNEKFSDSKGKSERFINYLKQLNTV